MQTNLDLMSNSATDLDEEIIKEVNVLAALSKEKIGQSFKAYSKKSLSRFHEFSIERKEKMLNQALTMQRIFMSDISPIQDDSKIHDEWYLIERSLKFYGLSLKDDFQKILQKDDVIEVYSSDHIQIFRTFNFYKYSAYSYLDLLVNEWFHLWERPSHLLQALYKIGMSVVQGERVGLSSMDEIPEHVYKEIYNSEDQASFESRSVKCKFGHIAPLYKPTGEIGGFIINCRVQVLSTGDETKKIAFI